MARLGNFDPQLTLRGWFGTSYADPKNGLLDRVVVGEGTPLPPFPINPFIPPFTPPVPPPPPVPFPDFHQRFPERFLMTTRGSVELPPEETITLRGPVVEPITILPRGEVVEVLSTEVKISGPTLAPVIIVVRSNKKQ